ncbi:MAG: hypothetical protein K8E24_013710 [Methanobacterium paludis]|nr:hypothetical protein [Methanobacterium paludis]
MSHIVERRMVDLVGKMINGTPLSFAEFMELKETHKCLSAALQKYDDLENLSLIAHMAGDYDWEMDLCAELEMLEG